MATHTTILERAVEGATPPRQWAEHQARYAFAAQWAAGRRVLDVACGSGYGSRMLADAGAALVVAVDRDAAAVDYASQRYARPGALFLQGDVCAPPTAGPFDLIASFETIEHLDEPERFVATCAGLLVAEGVFLVSTPYRHRVRLDGTPVNPFHKQEWQTEEFAALLGRTFGDVTLFGQALKFGNRRWQLPRRWVSWLARLWGTPLPDHRDLYLLPGPRILGLWHPLPAYLIAVCRKVRT